MAEQRKRSAYRAYNNAGAYIDGSTARRLDEVSVRTPEKKKKKPQNPPAAKKAPKSQNPPAAKKAPKPQTVSSQVKKNREKTMLISKGYVLFLTAACILIVLFSIHYLQLQTAITGRKKTVAALESELNRLKEENDAYYSQVTSGVDLNEVRETAIGSLGMKVPDDDQIRTYETEERSYVRQFQEVPDSDSR